MRTPHLIAGACTADDPEAPYRHAQLAIWDEYARSLVDYPRTWCSLEEGAMVLGEEVDELWDEVRGNRRGLARAEAAQVGAMAIRFIADLCQDGGGAQDRGRLAALAMQSARAAVGPGGRVLASTHEGFGFVRREYDALWSAVRFGDPTCELAARVAATALRFIAEISSGPAVVLAAAQ